MVCLPVCWSPGPPRSLSGPQGLSHLAGLEDVEHERQALGHQLLVVLVLLDGAEIPQEALHHRVTRLGEGRPQRLDPDVQLPGDAWAGKGQGSHPPGRALPKGPTEPTSGQLPFQQANAPDTCPAGGTPSALLSEASEEKCSFTLPGLPET